MGFFDKLFRNEQPKPVEPPSEDIANAIIEYLGCSSTILEFGLSADSMWQQYIEALKRGRRAGFTPVLLEASDALLDMLTIAAEDNGGVENCRNTLLSEPVAEGKTWLDNRFDWWMEQLEDGGEYPLTDEELNELHGKFTGADGFGTGPHSLDCKWRPKSVWLLAEIPTKNPWEVFAWVLFGGWNECPSNKALMCVIKYWYETFGAVPAIVTNDVLELYVAQPITDRDIAYQIAIRQYGFCNDAVEQGVGSIRALAEALVNSKIWYFWWD